MSQVNNNVTADRIAVAATATMVCAADVNRRSLTIVNNGTTAVDLGGAAVAPGGGIPIPPNGGAVSFDANDGAKGQWYAAVSGGGGDLCAIKVL